MGAPESCVVECASLLPSPGSSVWGARTTRWLRAWSEASRSRSDRRVRMECRHSPCRTGECLETRRLVTRRCIDFEVSILVESRPEFQPCPGLCYRCSLTRLNDRKRRENELAVWFLKLNSASNYSGESGRCGDVAWKLLFLGDCGGSRFRGSKSIKRSTWINRPQSVKNCFIAVI